MFQTHQTEMYINYKTLDYYMRKYLINVNYSNNVNIIIDFKECLRKIFRYGDFTDVSQDEYRSITVSEIINIIGHYRNYFNKQLKYTTFYFVFSENRNEKLIAKYPNYKKDYYAKYFDDPIIGPLVQNTITMCKNLIEGLPHCNWIDSSDYNEYIYTKYILDNYQQDINILLSNDVTLFSLLDKNVILFDCKGSNTSLITHENAIEKLTDGKFSFTNKLLPLVTSISGYNKYSISGVRLYSYNKACKVVKELIDTKKLSETDYYTIDFISLNNNVINMNLELIANNYDLFKPTMLLLDAKNKITELCKNIDTAISYNELLAVNERYFPDVEHSLDLNKILIGEDVIPN